MAKRRSRIWLTLIAALLIVLLVAYAFWPRPTLVDVGRITETSMLVTIDEEARTRVRDAYLVTAPVAGRLLRVEPEPGDEVIGGETVLARLIPISPSLLDIRTREQARAAIGAAEAALRMARADLNRAMADKELADADQTRILQLFAQGIATKSQRDQAVREARSAGAALDTAKAAISMREAELANARARLISFDQDQSSAGQTAAGVDSNTVPLTAPVSGRILQVMQESETTLTAGTPILEIGDTDNDLEVIVELLSTDAVKIDTGDRVVIDNWGGLQPLNGTVERIEPWGFTKYSALGVEEQRVNAIIRFTDPPAQRNKLGHGYRVEARIVVWENSQTLAAPSSALFREGQDWAVFKVKEGRAHLTRVKVGHNNGTKAQILEGIEAGQQVVLYPGPGLEDGDKVARRETE